MSDSDATFDINAYVVHECSTNRAFSLASGELGQLSVRFILILTIFVDLVSIVVAFICHFSK